MRPQAEAFRRSGYADTREAIANVLLQGDSNDIGGMLGRYQPEYTEVSAWRDCSNCRLVQAIA